MTVFGRLCLADTSLRENQKMRICFSKLAHFLISRASSQPNIARPKRSFIVLRALTGIPSSHSSNGTVPSSSRKKMTSTLGILPPTMLSKLRTHVKYWNGLEGLVDICRMVKRRKRSEFSAAELCENAHVFLYTLRFSQSSAPRLRNNSERLQGTVSSLEE